MEINKYLHMDNKTNGRFSIQITNYSQTENLVRIANMNIGQEALPYTSYATAMFTIFYQLPSKMA